MFPMPIWMPGNRNTRTKVKKVWFPGVGNQVFLMRRTQVVQISHLNERMREQLIQMSWSA